MAVNKKPKPPELAAEWEALGEPGAFDFFDRLTHQSIETIVTACRVYGRIAGDRLYELLIERATPRVKAAVRAVEKTKVHVLSAYDREEVEDELGHEFFEAVLNGESFFENRFNLAMHRVAQTAYRKVIEGKERTRERAAWRIVPSGDEAYTEPWAIAHDSLPGVVEDGASEVDGKLVAQAWLAHLPDEMAQAIALHVLMDLKVYSTNPEEHTVASTLGCSESKARKLIAEGLARLRELSGYEGTYD
ncbi:MAG: RNA polymerase sigma factor [Dehalococcoidia bacterium]